MGKRKPKKVDFKAAAMQQAEAAKDLVTQQTWANRAQQVNPYGSMDWSAEQAIDPATGKPVTRWTQTQRLDPKVQQWMDSRMALGQAGTEKAQQMLSSMGGLDLSNLPAMGTAPVADDATRQRVEQAMFERAMSRLRPEMEQAQRRMANDLAVRGISRDSGAFGRAQGDMDRRLNDMVSNATWDAILRGGQEQSRLFGLGMSAAEFANAKRAQALQEALAGRGADMQMLQYAGGLGVSLPQLPGFAGYNGAGAAEAPQLLNAAGQEYQMNVDRANVRNAAVANALNMAGKVGKFFLSDARVKRIHRRLGTHPRGVGVYLFNYRGDPAVHVGVLAQEVRTVAPELVHEGPDGLLRVDYGGL